MKELSKRSTWRNMTPTRASRASLASVSSTSSHENEGTSYQRTLDAILSEPRLAALGAVDVAPCSYNTYSFFSSIWSIRGRNFNMLIAPLIILLVWGVGWQLLFVYIFDEEESGVQEFLASMSDLVTPILLPLSFLLTFRLSRAAVRCEFILIGNYIHVVVMSKTNPPSSSSTVIRFWDARQACGKMVEVCRTNIATVCVGTVSPIRLLKKRHTIRHTIPSRTDNDRAQVESGNGENPDDDEYALELLCEYSRWLAVFPIAVKHFLRPNKRKGWRKEDRAVKRRFEIGTLLPDADARDVIMVYEDEKGESTFDAAPGTVRVRDPPLVVLNRLRELAYDIAYSTYLYRDDSTTCFAPSAQGRAILYQQISDQIDTLYGAFGAMERIKNTPLPFAYAIHLRTFLLLYSFLWNMVSVAEYGWKSLPFLFLLNWALLGVEAAAVECERPFDYNPNHLTLGKVCVLISRNIGQALRELAG